MSGFSTSVERIVDYKIVVSECVEELTTKVKEEMVDGWLPSGGVAVVSMQFGLRLVQTMVKKAIIQVKL